jgi:ribosomal protein L40E
MMEDADLMWLVAVGISAIVVLALIAILSKRGQTTFSVGRPCMSCGAHLPAHAKFCSQCGRRVEG